MFFILSKILLFLLKPLTWAILLLILWLSFKKFRKSKRLLWMAIGILYLFGNTFILSEIARLWENNNSSYLDGSNYEVGIVLGGYAAKDERRDRINFYEASGRLLHAIKLYKKGQIKKILLTGGSGSLLYTKNKEANSIEQYLSDIGIPKSDILIDAKARNTFENAVYSKEILDSLNYSNTLIFTSAFHAYRAKKCFNKQGLYPDILPTSYITKGYRQYDIGTFIIPSVTSLKDWNTLIKEWVGIIGYKLNGKI